MSHPALTPNAIRLIATDEDKTSDPSFQPVLQVMNVKKLASAPGAQDRYRVILSDGVHFLQGMLASQLTSLIPSAANQQPQHGPCLVPDCLVQLKSYMRNRVQNMTIAIALDMAVIHGPVPRIGNPTHFAGEESHIHDGNTGTAAAAPLWNKTNANATATPQKASPNNPYGQRSTPSSAPIVRSNHVPSSSSSSSLFTPIADLNMYQNRWTIRARVTHKAPIKTWSNAKGEGRLFSIDLQDETCDIRATFFKEAVDKWYHVLQVGSVYTITGGKLKVANMQWNTCKSPHELTLDQNSEIHLDTTGPTLATPPYDLVRIAALAEQPDKALVDVLGVVTDVGPVATILAKKTGKELTKCDVTLVDHSAASVALTLWGETAATVAPQLTAGASVLAVRRARVSDYNGKSLSGCQSYQVLSTQQVLQQHKQSEEQQQQEEPLQSQAAAVVDWWQANGQTAVPSLTATRGGKHARPKLADIQPLATIRQDHLGTAGNVDYISVKAEVSFLKKDKEGGAWYPACPNAGEPCQNRFKVTATTDGQYHCEKCGNYYPHCTRRWIFSALLEDESSSQWVSFFNDQAEALLGGATADQVYTAAYEENTMGDGTAAHEGYFSTALHSEWTLRCKVKQEMVNDEPRTKTQVVSLFPVDYVQDAKDMLAALQL